MATIPGIEEIRSFSRFGLSVVSIVFNDNVDVYWARQQVNERLSQAQQQIPEGMRLHVFSDLHLEFGACVFPPAVRDGGLADLVLLAGDIHTDRRAPLWAAETFAAPVGFAERHLRGT